MVSFLYFPRRAGRAAGAAFIEAGYMGIPSPAPCLLLIAWIAQKMKLRANNFHGLGDGVVNLGVGFIRDTMLDSTLRCRLGTDRGGHLVEIVSNSNGCTFWCDGIVDKRNND